MYSLFPSSDTIPPKVIESIWHCLPGSLIISERSRDWPAGFQSLSQCSHFCHGWAPPCSWVTNIWVIGRLEGYLLSGRFYSLLWYGAWVLSWCPVTRLEFFTYLYHWECQGMFKGFVWNQTAILSYRSETTSQISWPQISADHAAPTGSTNMALNISVNATASVSHVKDGDTRVLAPLLACENTWGMRADSVWGRAQCSCVLVAVPLFPHGDDNLDLSWFFIYYMCM